MEDKKTEKIKDDNLNLSFVKISKNLNLGLMKKVLSELKTLMTARLLHYSEVPNKRGALIIM
jgi:hypothetical protein